MRSHAGARTQCTATLVAQEHAPEITQSKLLKPYSHVKAWLHLEEAELVLHISRHLHGCLTGCSQHDL